MSIVQCESSGRADAIGAASEVGLFQIAPLHAWRVGGDVKRLLDPETNIRVAWEIYSEQGWRPWSCKP